MISTEELETALYKLYGAEPPKKVIKLAYIREVVACYLCVHTDLILEEYLQKALRNIDFALPKPKLRNKPGQRPEIDWYFIKREAISVSKGAQEKQVDKGISHKPVKKRKYRNKSLVDSFKMVAS